MTDRQTNHPTNKQAQKGVSFPIMQPASSLWWESSMRKYQDGICGTLPATIVVDTAFMHIFDVVSLQNMAL